MPTESTKQKKQLPRTHLERVELLPRRVETLSQVQFYSSMSYQEEWGELYDARDELEAEIERDTDEYLNIGRGLLEREAYGMSFSLDSPKKFQKNNGLMATGEE